MAIVVVERPVLEEFERSVLEKRPGEALDLLWKILVALDRSYGRPESVEFISGAEPGSARQHLEFATRLAAAIGHLVLTPGLDLTFSQYEQFQLNGRWIELIFNQSGFAHADPFVRLLGPKGPSLDIPAENMLKFQLLYLPGSEIPANPDVLAHGNAAGAIVAGLSLIGSRYHFGRRAFDRREQWLRWLPARLDQVKLGEMTLAAVTEPYFHCSYALLPEKHEVKASLMSQLHRALTESGVREWQPGDPVGTKDGKPLFVVTADYINRGDSIWRTHSRALRALRSRFHVLGIGQAAHISDSLGDLFDETMPLPEGRPFFETVKTVADAIRARAPAGVMHVAVGMVAPIVGLAAMRLAPVQFTSYGHTATTRSPAIDHFVLPEDFVGDPTTFSENVMALPQAAFPYEQRTDVDFEALKRGRRPNDDVVHVAVPGTVMKLNPVLFETLAEIGRRARRKVQFHFFPGFSVGLPYRALEREIHGYLPRAEVNQELTYSTYCAALARCAFTLSPFPYGNMNTVIESVALGLPGVCLDGPEAHTHADGALYRRLGMPEELIARSIPGYVEAALRLIDNVAYRQEAQRRAAKAPLARAIYDGNPQLFADAIYDKVAPFL